MKFFVDTANIAEIRELNSLGFLDGVTTNPSLVAKEGKDFKAILKEICEEVKGSVSAEVAAIDHQNMLKEAEELIKIAENITIKLPLTLDGLKTCKYLSNNKIDVNLTLCFSASQAILAAKAGARYVSPFVGRHDDISYDGLNLIADIKEIYENYPEFQTEIIVASIRHPIHIIESAKLGADIATIPAKIFGQLVKHPLTDIGLQNFLADWKASGQKIL